MTTEYTLNSPTTIMLCGVGGQGTITAADLVARAALDAGYDVKVSEIHGMAQRGGSVSTTVRFGTQVASMVCDDASADVVVAFELIEALRNITALKPDGHLIVDKVAIKPMPVLTGSATMPENEIESLQSLGSDSVDVVDAHDCAVKAGNAKCANVALLATAARYLPIDKDSWIRAITSRVPPKTLEANLSAFNMMYCK